MVTVDADSGCNDMKQQQTAVSASVPLQKLPCNHSPRLLPSPHNAHAQPQVQVGQMEVTVEEACPWRAPK